MTATPQDFIRASPFVLRDDIAKDATELSLTHSTTGLTVPATTAIGSRIKIVDGASTDFYRITTATTGSLQTGVRLEWVNLGISPTAVRAYTAGISVDFVPYASLKAAIPEQQTKVAQGHGLELTDYFSMTGGKDSDLSFSVRAGGPYAKLAVSGSVLTLAGVSAGTMSATVTCFDKAQGRPTQTFRIIVGVANRAPVSDRAIGNPTVNVGQTLVFDLDTYFSDPDGDSLAYQATGDDPAVATVTNPGSILRVTGVSRGKFTLLVDASDGLLTISQQVHVTVPANRRPIVADHIQPLALAVGGPDVTVSLERYFRDPDTGAALAYTVQFEEGDPAHQYRQEVWYPHTTSGSSGLTMDSAFAYPPGSGPPWGAGSPWVVPAGTPFVQMGTYAGVLTATRRVTHGARTAAWNAGSRKVVLTNVVFTTPNPAGASSTPVRGLYGATADVAWPAVAGQVLTLAPGASPGHRTLYIEAYDAGGLAASQLAVISLGRGPVASAIPLVELFTGADAVVRLDDHFSDPDGDALTYAVAGSVPHVVSTRLARRQVVSAGSISTATDLHVHGVTAGDVNLTVTATDAIGLTVAGTVDVTVRASAVALPAPMFGPTVVTELEQVMVRASVDATIELPISADPPFRPGEWIRASFGASIASSRSVQFLIFPHSPGYDDPILPGDRLQTDQSGNAIFRVADVPRYFGGHRQPETAASGWRRVFVVFEETPTVTAGDPALTWTGYGLAGQDISTTIFSFLPRLSAREEPIRLVIRVSEVVANVDLDDYLSEFTVLIPTLNLSPTVVSIPAGAAIRIRGRRFTVSAVSSRYVGDRVSYYECSLIPAPIAPLGTITVIWADAPNKIAIPAAPLDVRYDFDFTTHQVATTPDDSQVTYSAFGLPSGLSMSDAGVISGIPVGRGGDSLVTVRATSGTIWREVTFRLTVGPVLDLGSRAWWLAQKNFTLVDYRPGLPTIRTSTTLLFFGVYNQSTGLWEQFQGLDSADLENLRGLYVFVDRWPTGWLIGVRARFSLTPIDNRQAGSYYEIYSRYSELTKFPPGTQRGPVIKVAFSETNVYPWPGLSLTWADASPQVAIPGATIGAVYSFSYLTNRVATHSLGAAIVYTATGLPSGLSMSTAGLITGTPDGSAGTSNVTVTATSGAVTARDAFDLVVAAAAAPVVRVTFSNPFTAAEVVAASWVVGVGGNRRGTADIYAELSDGRDLPSGFWNNGAAYAFYALVRGGRYRWSTLNGYYMTVNGTKRAISANRVYTEGATPKQLICWSGDDGGTWSVGDVVTFTAS